MCWVCKTVIKDSLLGWKRFMMLAFLPALVNFRKRTGSSISSRPQSSHPTEQILFASEGNAVDVKERLKARLKRLVILVEAGNGGEM